MDRKVLVVAESDDQMRKLSLALRENGLDAYGTSVPSEAMRAVYSFRPSLLVVDMDIPDFDGWDMCVRVRDLADTPIIVLSEHSERSDLLKGYEVGVDGYMLKPFSTSDLVQRIFSIMGRKASTNGELQVPAPFQRDNLTIDWSRNDVRVNGAKIGLTPTEFKLLSCLVQSNGRIVTHEQILTRVWGPEYVSDKSYVKLYIRYLREKIEVDPSNPRWIATERGFGYKFVA